MKFTKTEIDLCKQIAELWRRSIKYGDWFLNEGGFVKVWPWQNCRRTDVIPLWQIQDALDWLKEKNYYLGHIDLYGNRIVIHFNLPISSGKDKPIDSDGKTLLEAFLKAVLEILRKEGTRDRKKKRGGCDNPH